MGTANQYAINLLAQGIGRFFTFGANFIVFVLIARIGGTDFFGKYSYVITFLGLFMLIADFGMTSLLGRDIAQVRDSAESYWGNFLMLRVGANIVAIAGSIIAAYYLRRDLFLILFVGSLSLPFLSARFFEPIFQVYKKPWLSMWSSVFYGLSYLLLLSLVLLYFPLSLTSAIVAFIIANILFAFFTYYLTQRIIKPEFVVNPAIMKQILRLACPLGISSMFALISGRVPIFMLAAMKSDYDVGIFNAACRFFDMSAIMATILIGPFIPIFSAKALHDLNKVKRISIMIVELVGVFFIPIAIATPVLSPFIISTFFGSAFLLSAQVLNVLSWAGILVFYSLLSSAIVLSIGVVHFGYWNTMVAALLSLLLNYALIPRFSFLGAAYATVACEIFLSGVTIFYVTRHVGNLFKGSHWLRIASANIVLYGTLYHILLQLSMPIKIITSLFVYILLIFLFKAIPGETVKIVTDTLTRKYAR